MDIPISSTPSCQLATDTLASQKCEVTPACSVGNTVVASMWNLAAGSEPSRNAENLVLTVTRKSCESLGASASIVQLVQSLVWPFIAIRSQRAVWFTDKELQRCISSFRETAKRIMKHSSVDNREQSYIKYWLDSLLCIVFKGENTRPIREDWNTQPLFVGWNKRFIARRLARRDLSFIYSLQKGSKQFWPALGDVKKSEALAKHAKRITEYRGAIPEDLERTIKSCSKRIFGRAQISTKFMPSGSACLQASRRDGGALSLFSKFTLPLNTRETAVIGKLPVLNAELNIWRNNQFLSAYNAAVKKITTPSQDGYLTALDVDVMAIPEPGKFRIITKGDGHLYTALQPIQGLLLGSWKKSFASTMTQDINVRVVEIDNAVKLPFWCSVDYEAATDLLKRDATLSAFQPLMDLPFSDLAWLSLMAGRAKYPDGTIVDAIEGQLMGHPLSFPLLCVINLAVYLCAIKRWVGSDSSRKTIGEAMKRNVLVNGDDMLFKCEKSFYPIFLSCAKEAGFKESVGKNYLSKDCCMINSQTYRRVDGKMKRFGYLNLRIITGSSLKGGESGAVPTQIGKDLNEMVKLCPWAASAIPACFRRWSKDWFGPIYRPNWYLPVHLGGFGVDINLAPCSLRITKSQREMAARFVHDPRMALYRREGMNIPTAELAGALARWRMVPGPYVGREGESTDINDQWLARLAYAARAAHGSLAVSDDIFIAKFRPQYRLKAMSLDKIKLYWSAQVFASKLPPCPPIGSIRTRSM